MSAVRPVLRIEPDAIRCPYPYYQKLRETGRLVFDDDAGIYIAPRYNDILRINTQPAIFSNANPMGPAISAAMQRLADVLADRDDAFRARAMTVLQRGNVLFTADPPEHSRHRRLLNKALTPASVSRIEPAIAQYCNDLIDGFEQSTPVDIVTAYTTPAPIDALSRLLGLDPDRSRDFYRWASAINATIGTDIGSAELLAAIEDQMDFWSFFEHEIASRKGRAGDDLLTRIANGRSGDDKPLTTEEMVGFCSQLVAAGADTTTKLLTSAIDLLSRDSALQSQLRGQRGGVVAFLEEVLRLEPPVQGMFRVVTQTVEFAGHTLEPGALVWCLYASGNRDDTVFENPDALCPERANLRRHLSFGHGPHVCIGANLARTVARIALTTLLERTSEFELADPAAHHDYEPSYVMHGIRYLPIRIV